jgi:carboxypeptidase Q
MASKLFLLSAGLLAACAGFSQNAADQIKEQGLQKSKVMDYAFQLTDVSGPRLTNSPGYFRAANWAKAELTKLGLTNAALEPWGDFGKGWELKKSYIAMTAPYYRPLIGFPKTWTKGTKGLKSAEVIVVKAKDSAELESYRGKLKGKLVLMFKKDTLKPTFKADAERHTDEALTKMANAEPPKPREGGGPRRTVTGSKPLGTLLREMAESEAAVALLSASPRGHDGTIFVQGGGAYGAKDPENFTDMMVAFEDYMSLQRLAESGIPVKVDIETQTEFFTKDIQGYNVVAEIKGTDPKLKDEIVMLGGHLDSWQGSTGATDNAAGCAVMMEAMRIIQQSGLKPKRTIRIALWGGEEQGLHGSRNYVKNHFADPATMQLKPAHEKISAYYNIDNGTGKVRGIYLQGNEGVRNIFTEWLQPFKELGASTVTISNTGGTDHLAFDAVGIPGFQFIQDEIEYDTRTHHTNMDSYDHLQAEDLKQIATVVAYFVYNTANRDEKLPRKALPAARN